MPITVSLTVPLARRRELSYTEMGRLQVKPVYEEDNRSFWHTECKMSKMDIQGELSEVNSCIERARLVITYVLYTEKWAFKGYYWTQNCLWIHWLQIGIYLKPWALSIWLLSLLPGCLAAMLSTSSWEIRKATLKN